MADGLQRPAEGQAVASGKGSSVASARVEMLAMPELLEAVQPHTQLGTSGRCLDCLQFNCAGCAAAQWGLARLQEKPSPLSPVLHASSRGMEIRALETKFVLPPPPNLAPLNPCNPVQPKRPWSHLQGHCYLCPLERHPPSYKGRPQAEQLGSYHWNRLETDVLQRLREL